MPWDAIDALDESRTATQSLLLPLSWRTWLRLVVVTFFVGGVGGGGGGLQAAQGAAPSPPTSTITPPPDLPSVPTALLGERVGLTLLLALAVVVVILVALYTVVGAVMEFVLVEVLRTRQAELRRPFRQFLTPGLRLFVFRLGVLVVLGIAAAVPALALLGFISVSLAGVLFLPVLAIGIGFLWLCGLLILRLTTDFVVPTMIAEGRTVLSAWRRVLGVLRAEWREVGLYLVIRLLISLVASVAVGLIVGLAALVVAIPFIAVGAAVSFSVGLQGIGLVIAVGLASVFLVVVVVMSIVVQVPVVTYVRYYGLFVLGGLDAQLDLLRTTTRTASLDGDSP